MQFRCPTCRRATHVSQDLVEHLARCERCGALLRVRALAAANGAWTVVLEAIPRPPVVQKRWTPTGLFAAPARARWPGAAPGMESEAISDPLAELIAVQRAMPPRQPWRKAPPSLKARLLGLLTIGSVIVLVATAVLGAAVWLKAGGGAMPRAAAAEGSRAHVAPARSAGHSPGPASASASGDATGELFPQVGAAGSR